mgnify:CR=1 FL=1
MNIVKYLAIHGLVQCRIMYIICNFSSIANIINRQDRVDYLTNLVKQTFLIILYAFLTGIVLFTIWISFWLVCALDNHCYSSYVGV